MGATRIRVLHVVKTSDGAPWAADQAAVLTRLGVEIHVALPSLSGMAVAAWRRAGAILHEANLNVPVGQPWLLPSVVRRARRLVSKVAPDLIHSHFVTTTLLLRWALGKGHRTPRIYQVAGPLHLEHCFPRFLEISSAGARDFWIGSSRCIVSHYLRVGIPKEKIFLSYYGSETRRYTVHQSDDLRRRVGASHDDIIVGDISYFYPPKRYLGHNVGVKCHEDLIDALGIVIKDNPRAIGVLVGGAWGDAAWYEEKLRRRAKLVGNGRICLPGRLSLSEARRAWKDFDLAVHVPLSENCGGVIEPLLAGVPTVASEVGGLPEVVMPDITGWLVPPRRVRTLARVILRVMEQKEHALLLAKRGQMLVKTMFDVERTGAEVFEIYRHVLDRRAPRPADFSARTFLRSVR